MFELSPSEIQVEINKWVEINESEETLKPLQFDPNKIITLPEPSPECDAIRIMKNRGYAGPVLLGIFGGEIKYLGYGYYLLSLEYLESL